MPRRRPDPLTLSVTVDDVKSGDSIGNGSMIEEKNSREADIDEGVPPGNASKPGVVQPPPKKSKKEDQNVQWLGEKVTAPRYERAVFLLTGPRR